jgi:hypothetical protein
MNTRKSSRFDGRAAAPTMSREKTAESFLPEQLELYTNQPPLPGSLNDESIVRGIVTETIRKSTKSREEIAEQMSALCGDHITVRMLNSYTSEAAEQHRWPAQYTRAFCQVLENWELLRCITERSGFHLINDDQAQLLELGRQFLIRKRADEQIALLEARLHGRKTL